MAVIDVSGFNPQIINSKTYYDSVTGCKSYDDQAGFELCRQTFYIKQQATPTAQVERTKTQEVIVASLPEIKPTNGIFISFFALISILIILSFVAALIFYKFAKLRK